MKPLFLARQSANPTGLLGHLIAKVMAYDTWAENEAAIAQLPLREGDAVLDFGCGHGGSLAGLAAQVGPEGVATGVDRSPVMVREATSRNQGLITAGRIEVSLVESMGRLPFWDESFDAIMTMHTLYFVPDMVALFEELCRVLKPEGHLLIGFQSVETASGLPQEIYQMRKTSEVQAAAKQAGLSFVSQERKQLGRRVVSLLLVSKP